MRGGVPPPTRLIRNIQNIQLAVYIFDTHVILKQGQGHQTVNDNLKPKQGYNHAKFERSCFSGVREKGNVKGLLLFF